MRRLLQELKRRNVYKVGVAYAVVTFVVVQLADLAAGAFGLPGWFEPMIWVLCGLGLLPALVIAWAFELTPEGVRRTPAPEESGSERASVSEPGANLEPGWSPSRMAATGLVALGAVLAAVAGGWYLMGSGGERPPPAIGEQTVAVLPFEVSGAGADTWRDGMVTMLSTGLDGTAGLRAIPDRTVLAAWREQGRTGTGASSEEAVSVAREVGARYAIVGSAVALGDEVRLTANVRSTRAGDRLGQVGVRGSPDSITSLADSLTRQVLGVMLEESEAAIPSVDLADLTTRSMPALKSYLAGERHLRVGEYDEARREYETAVDLDSTFALAWDRLQTARFITDARGVGEAAARAAALSDDQLPERARRRLRASSLWVPRELPQAARDSLRRLSEDYPDDPRIWSALAEPLYHNHVPGGWPEAEEAKARAIELDPGDPSFYNHFVDLAFALHQDSAMAAERIPQHPPTEFRVMWRVALDLVFGPEREREAAFDRLDSLPVSTLWQLTNALNHPTDGDLQEEALRRILKRDGILRPRYVRRRILNSLEHGRIQRALNQIRDGPPVLDQSGWWGCRLIRSATLDLPVPDSVIERGLDLTRVEGEPSIERLMCRGIYLVERERTGELSGLLDRIRGRGAETDPSLSEARVRAVVNEVRGYRAWQEGQLDRAVDLWSAAQQSSWAGAIWRGNLYRERGELQKAEEWYIAAWPHPVAHERLGRLYEEMDKPQEAKAAYRRFIAAWEDADPELQYRVEAVQERLKVLTASEADTDD